MLQAKVTRASRPNLARWNLAIWNIAIWCGISVCLAASGCGSSDVQFGLNRLIVPPTNLVVTSEESVLAQQNLSTAEVEEKLDALDETYRRNEEMLTSALVAVFGTPDDPFAWPGLGLDIRKLRMAAGPTGVRGVTRGLYREHCVHCHGINGDGLGPTARFLNPYPRNFQLGVFKFTSTNQGRKPTMGDLHQTLRDGIPGTAMPSFKLNSTAEVEALAEYAKYLSIRGEVQLQLMTAFQAAGGAVDEKTLEEELNVVLELVGKSWGDAPEYVVIPAQRPPFRSEQEKLDSIARGKAIFLNAGKANCLGCHGPTGLGDGGQVDYDVWTKMQREQVARFPGLANYWPLPVRPAEARNLHLGIYRGGRRPVDLYRRIYAGIKGTPMPAQGQTLKSDEIWSVVDYVMSLPYQHESPQAIAPTAHRVGL